jgi:hypothetical protein
MGLLQSEVHNEDCSSHPSTPVHIYVHVHTHWHPRIDKTIYLCLRYWTQIKKEDFKWSLTKDKELRPETLVWRMMKFYEIDKKNIMPYNNWLLRAEIAQSV